MGVFAPGAAARSKHREAPQPQQPSPGELNYFEPNVGQFPGDVRFKVTAGHYEVEFYDSSFILVSIFPDRSAGDRPEGDGDLSIEGCLSEPATCVFAEPNLRVEKTEIRFDHASATPVGLTPTAGISNYYIGPDPAAHFTGIGWFSSIIYSDLYPGIDMVFRFNSDGLLEFDLVVEAGADPDQFGLKPKGGAKAEIEADGTLMIADRFGAYAQSKPVVIADDGSEGPEARFVKSRGAVRIELLGPAPSGSYVIDPVISYSTYVGTSTGDGTIRTTKDSSGNVYSVGFGVSEAFPNQVAAKVWRHARPGQQPWHARFERPDGASVGLGIALSPNEHHIGIVGITTSPSFPTWRFFDGTLDGAQDAFVARLNSGWANDNRGGDLEFSTYLGGNEQACPAVAPACVLEAAQGISFDPVFHGEFDDGNLSLVVAGFTNAPDLPTTPGAFQPSLASVPSTDEGAGVERDAFIAKLKPEYLNPTDRLQFLTYFGGTDDEYIDIQSRSEPASSGGDIWLAGMTNGQVPAPGGFQSTNAGSYDLFVARFANHTAATQSYGTMLGGDGFDVNTDLEVGAGVATVMADTDSTNLASGGSGGSPAQAGFGGGRDAYVAQVMPSSPTQVYGSYLGGSSEDLGRGVDVIAGPGGVGTPGQKIFVSGAAGVGFPEVNAAVGNACGRGNRDGFVAMIDTDDALPLSHSGCVGGSGLDNSEDIYVYDPTPGAERAALVGPTESTDFEVEKGTPGTDPPYLVPYKATKTGYMAGFVSIVDFTPLPPDQNYIAFASNRKPAPPADQTYSSSAIWKMGPMGESLAHVTPLEGQTGSYSGGYGAPGTHPGADIQPAISPNGRRILYVSNRNPEAQTDLYLVDKDGPATYSCRLTNDPWVEDRPVWSPDGMRIAFSADGHGTTASGREVFVATLFEGDNSCSPGQISAIASQLTYAGPAQEAKAPAFSPDSNCVAYMLGSGYVFDLAIVPLPSSPCPWSAGPITADGAFNSYPAWSAPTPTYPVGRIAFASLRQDVGETGPPDDVRIWVIDATELPTPSPIRLTGFGGNFTGASSPAWSPDGGTLMAYGSEYPDGDYDIFSLDPNSPDPDNPAAHHNLIEDPPPYADLGIETTTFDWWPSYGTGAVGPPGTTYP